MAKFESITGRLENFNDHKIKCLKHQLNVFFSFAFCLSAEILKHLHKQSMGHKFWFAIKVYVQKAKTVAEDDMQLTKKISSLFYRKTVCVLECLKSKEEKQKMEKNKNFCCR